MIRLSAFALILISLASYAKAETWKCTETKYSTDVLVVAKSDKATDSGTIIVADTEYSAKYTVQGFDRRWSFDLADDFSYNYSFLIAPSGEGRYYDFSTEKSVKPSMFFFCRKE